MNYQRAHHEALVGVSTASSRSCTCAAQDPAPEERRPGASSASSRAELAQSIANKTLEKPKEPPLRLPAKEAAASIEDFFASHAQDGVARPHMDGFLDGGPVESAIIRPLNEAGEHASAAMPKDATRRYRRDHRASTIPGKANETLRRSSTMLPAIGGSLSKSGAIVALELGERGQPRTAADPRRKWSDRQIQAILDTLDQNDWRFVQEIWDFIDRPTGRRSRQATASLPASRREGRSARRSPTKFGDDARRLLPDQVPTVGSRPDAALERSTSRGERRACTPPTSSTTERGHTSSGRRHSSSGAPRSRRALITSSQVIHDLTHHEVLIDVGRILARSAGRGADHRDLWRPVHAAIHRRASRTSPLGGTPAANMYGSARELCANRARRSRCMGWNLWTAMQQPLGLFTARRASARRGWRAGMNRWIRDAATMENDDRVDHDVSTFMRTVTLRDAGHRGAPQRAQSARWLV